jgi:hypothetical protein
MCGLDELFDFNHDGELDLFEETTEYMAISGEFDKDDANDWNDDE